MQPRRAVILFVRDGRREAAVKPLPARYVVRGYDVLNRRVAARVARLAGADADLVIATNGPLDIPGTAAQIPQRGASFGQRLGNAIADTLALGYASVVAVGNDCPELAAADLAAAFAALDAGACLVAAPTVDGGAFLVGARGDSFPAAAFIHLPWRTSSLFAALGRIPGAATLPILRADFDAWTGRDASRALAGLLGDRDRSVAPPVIRHPLVSSSGLRALMRIHLPAPPLG